MTPPPIDKDEKKIKILKAAMDVFAEKGFHTARMADVAEVAEIGKGTIYEYFRSKEDLFMELFTFVMKGPIDYQFQKRDPTTKPAEKLEKLIASSLKAYHKMEKFYYVLINFRAEHRESHTQTFYRSQFATLYKEFRKEVGAIIEEGIRDGTFKKVNTDHLAYTMIAVMEGLMSQWVFDRKAIPLKKLSVLITDMFLTYLKK